LDQDLRILIFLEPPLDVDSEFTKFLVRK